MAQRPRGLLAQSLLLVQTAQPRRDGARQGHQLRVDLVAGPPRHRGELRLQGVLPEHGWDGDEREGTAPTGRCEVGDDRSPGVGESTQHLRAHVTGHGVRPPRQTGTHQRRELEQR
ncbi:MAG: hypothetical protein LWW86_00935 [Micrococcales bacterium]|nr:hypothetical protein [Micrococcales bacterium]